MSFRARLTTFFLLIVVVPMIAVGFLVFRLISDSEQGKTDARASGVLSVATNLYESESISASSDARTLARNLGAQLGSGRVDVGAVRATVSAASGQTGLARVVVRLRSRTIADVGSRTAMAPGTATIQGRGITVLASELTAAQYLREVAVPGTVVVVHEGPRLLASSRPLPGAQAVPAAGSATLGGIDYRAASQDLPSFGRSPVDVTVLAGVAATAGSVSDSRVLAVAFIVAFLLLALSFSVLASRGLQGQLSRFLLAARRLARGDFSSPVPVEGSDEFAALGQEFNNMSSQLEQRLDELSQERGRLREAIRRIGETFAANLDRPALLDLALKTAIDAVEATGGRISAASGPEHPLAEFEREGSLDAVMPLIVEAEQAALAHGDIGESAAETNHVLSIPVGLTEEGSPSHGLITVVREADPFSDDDRELLRSLAAQAGLALENVNLHVQVSRQAVTDDLTGLANHGRFQELLVAEIEQVRRYRYPIGLIMLDIDNFKSVNDTFGHQQGDVVLKRVARVLIENSREVDTPARYGGEELAVILPHTDLEGVYAIAERIRTSIAALRIPCLDSRGTLRVTSSLGVAASSDAEKDALIADADAALYQAKRQGKNRTVTAPVQAAT